MGKNSSVIKIPEPKISVFLFADTRMAWLWLILRLYVGWQWLHAGWEKIVNPAWVGAHSGMALKGFLMGALAKTGGAHPSVQGWYGEFIKGFALPNVVAFSYTVSFGELLVGIGLILGAFTGVAAFFGAFMNINYLLAGTLSTNPVLLVCEIFLVAAWKTAGWIGLDRFLLRASKKPWHPGKIFKK